MTNDVDEMTLSTHGTQQDCFYGSTIEEGITNMLTIDISYLRIFARYAWSNNHDVTIVASRNDTVRSIPVARPNFGWEKFVTKRLQLQDSALQAQ